mmetsp:Transcript_107691/g.301603  ORF Transcript_107691/g.301603 Transcript_107691/m.301603 type:complete len:214 (-) Transcript_107691:241-882(-)
MPARAAGPGASARSSPRGTGPRRAPARPSPPRRSSPGARRRRAAAPRRFPRTPCARPRDPPRKPRGRPPRSRPSARPAAAPAGPRAERPAAAAARLDTPGASVSPARGSRARAAPTTTETCPRPSGALWYRWPRWGAARSGRRCRWGIRSAARDPGLPWRTPPSAARSACAPRPRWSATATASRAPRVPRPPPARPGMARRTAWRRAWRRARR